MGTLSIGFAAITRWAALDQATVRQLVSLHDAQFVLAREQGFASWPKLKAYAEPSSRSRHTRLFVADVAWIMDRVHGLLLTRHSAGPAALEQIREWHPRFSEKSDEEIRQAPFTEEDARLVYAREHGFETWDDLTSREPPRLDPCQSNRRTVHVCVRRTAIRRYGWL